MRLLAVPFIEPSVAPTIQGEVVSRSLTGKRGKTENQMDALKAWFSEGEWERTSPKILETSQGMLLVNSYHDAGRRPGADRPLHDDLPSRREFLRKKSGSGGQSSCNRRKVLFCSSTLSI